MLFSFHSSFSVGYSICASWHVTVHIVDVCTNQQMPSLSWLGTLLEYRASHGSHASHCLAHYCLSNGAIHCGRGFRRPQSQWIIVCSCLRRSCAKKERPDSLAQGLGGLLLMVRCHGVIDILRYDCSGQDSWSVNSDDHTSGRSKSDFHQKTEKRGQNLV